MKTVNVIIYEYDMSICWIFTTRKQAIEHLKSEGYYQTKTNKNWFIENLKDEEDLIADNDFYSIQNEYLYTNKRR